MYENHGIQTKKEEAEENPRLLGADVDQEWPQSTCTTPCKGPETLIKVKTVRTPLFSLKIVPSEKMNVAAVVPKRVSKKAVERNLIKRRLRSAVIHKFSTPVQVTFVALPSIVGKTFQEIKSEVEQAMKKI